jgi:hypothetical protein
LKITSWACHTSAITTSESTFVTITTGGFIIDERFATVASDAFYLTFVVLIKTSRAC